MRHWLLVGGLCDSRLHLLASLLGCSVQGSGSPLQPGQSISLDASHRFPPLGSQGHRVYCVIRQGQGTEVPKLEPCPPAMWKPETVTIPAKDSVDTHGPSCPKTSLCHWSGVGSVLGTARFSRVPPVP